MLQRLCLAIAIVILAVPAWAEGEIPDLVGQWEGARTSFVIWDGHFKYVIEEPFTAYVIDKQEGRLIAGEKLAKLDVEGRKNGEEFFGVISPDNTKVYVAEHASGYAVFHLMGPDQMEVTYVSDGSGDQEAELVASIQRLQRRK